MGPHAGLQRKDQQISEFRDVTNTCSNIINYFYRQQLKENGNNQHQEFGKVFLNDLLLEVDRLNSTCPRGWAHKSQDSGWKKIVGSEKDNDFQNFSELNSY